MDADPEANWQKQWTLFYTDPLLKHASSGLVGKAIFYKQFRNESNFCLQDVKGEIWKKRMDNGEM